MNEETRERSEETERMPRIRARKEVLKNLDRSLTLILAREKYKTILLLL